MLIDASSTIRIMRRAQRGLSLVEMMVGIAVGLFIVAGATMLAGAQLTENRRLILETQLQQDLRATADIITRELRRAGYDNNQSQLVWSPFKPTPAAKQNNWIGLALNTGGEVVNYSYGRIGSFSNFGYRLNNNVIQQRIGNGSPQDLTDKNTMKVTAFTVNLQAGPNAQIACPRLCSDGTQNCWPTQAVYEATVDITAESPSDPAIRRSIQSTVRLRNDGAKFNISATQACP